MLLYFLLGLIAVGVLVLSDIGKTVLYVIGILLLIIGIGYGIFYSIVIFYGISISIVEHGPFLFFKKNWVPVFVGITVLGLLGSGLFKKIGNSKKKEIAENHLDTYSLLQKIHLKKHNP